MKEKLLNNLGLKIISLVLAFVVWMAVVNISNPVMTDDQDVPLEVRNEMALEAENLTYEILGKSTINVKYDIRTRDASLIKASDFHATIDLKDFNVTGAIPVTVEINKEKESLIVNKENMTAKPMVIRFSTEPLQRKQFNLGTIINGTPEEGYVPGIITLSPDTVWVKGPESEIGKINSMGIEIDASGANADLEGTATPAFYDANGKRLELSEKVTVGVEDIHYTVSILKAKNLNLVFEVKGNVADGYRFTGVETEVKQAAVIGTKSVLASISSITVADDKLDITGATADRVVTLDVRDYLPPGTSLVGDMNGVVKVILRIEPLAIKTFTLATADLQKKGAVADYEYSFDKEKIDVRVRGLKEDLDTLEAGDLNAVLTVEGLGPGSYPASMSFEIGEGFEVVDYSGFGVAVVSEDEENTESEGGETAETVNGPAGETKQADTQRDETQKPDTQKTETQKSNAHESASVSETE